MSLSTFLAFRNPVLNFLNSLNSRVLLSYKPLSYIRKTCIISNQTMRIVVVVVVNEVRYSRPSTKLWEIVDEKNDTTTGNNNYRIN